MNIRLAGGVVAAEQCAWVPGTSGPVRLDGSNLRPGAAVALGPEGADEADVRHAVAELRRLVAGGDEAAGAGVDLGGGFRSGRLAGARGDRRDAVLAALKIVGVQGVGRLGDRAAVMVALFGPSVTKRVGAAAAKAAEEGRWDALHLASAASDVLGPEQLEVVLGLDAPVQVVRGGSPSMLADHLSRAFEAVPRARRSRLVVDLWNRVAEHHAECARRERRRATQGKRDRVGDLRARRRRYENDNVIEWARWDELGTDVALGDALRWVPPKGYWTAKLETLHQDALAATALLRTAVAVADHGLEEGLARSEKVLAAAMRGIREGRFHEASKRVPGLTGHPVRPVVYVRDLHRRVGRRADAKLAAHVEPRLGCARDYALVIVDEIVAVLEDDSPVPETELRLWLADPLDAWRRDAGYSDARPPAKWDTRPVRWLDRVPATEPLNARLDGRDPAEVEDVGDLLWYAELIDALAQVHGHDAAGTTPGTGAPWFEYDPEPEPAQPFVGYESIPQAVAGAAQLAALGGVPPRGAATWPAFVAGLLAGTAVTEALTGEFPIPGALAERDGAEVGGHRVKLARSVRDLAEWSAYMGNCLATAYDVEAREGRSVLVGLFGADGLLAANAELVSRKPAARGWHVEEIAGRFNHPVDRALEEAFSDWVDAIHRTAPVAPADAPGDDELPPARPVRRRTGARLLQDAGPALQDAVRLDDRASAALGAVAAPAALPRLGDEELAAACRRALDGGAGLVRLWDATAHRPLRDAVEGLDPAVRDRFHGLPLLFGEPPLPKSLRRLVKLPVIADAYALDLAARRIRRAVGLLAVRDDPVLARAVRHRTTEPLLCALTVRTTCAADGPARVAVTEPRAETVPGYPATSLADADGPWRRALADARELGADAAVSWDAIAGHGLRVPASWLPPAGWPALWARAHR